MTASAASHGEQACERPPSSCFPPTVPAATSTSHSTSLMTSTGSRPRSRRSRRRRRPRMTGGRTSTAEEGPEYFLVPTANPQERARVQRAIRPTVAALDRARRRDRGAHRGPGRPRRRPRASPGPRRPTPVVAVGDAGARTGRDRRRPDARRGRAGARRVGRSGVAALDDRPGRPGPHRRSVAATRVDRARHPCCPCSPRGARRGSGRPRRSFRPSRRSAGDRRSSTATPAQLGRSCDDTSARRWRAGGVHGALDVARGELRCRGGGRHGRGRLRGEPLGARGDPALLRLELGRRRDDGFRLRRPRPRGGRRRARRQS